MKQWNLCANAHMFRQPALVSLPLVLPPIVSRQHAIHGQTFTQVAARKGQSMRTAQTQMCREGIAA